MLVSYPGFFLAMVVLPAALMAGVVLLARRSDAPAHTGDDAEAR
jgi:hypothetical protein